VYAREGVVIWRAEEAYQQLPRVAGYHIGPQLNAYPVIWEPKHPNSVEQALSRNLCQPAEHSADLSRVIASFNAALVTDGADPLGVRPCKAVGQEEAYFVEAQRANRSKYISYLAAYLQILTASMFDYYSAAVQKANFFVKKEVMAPGKMPRAIIDVPKHEVLSLRPYDNLVEEFTRLHASVKGVPAAARAECLQRAMGALGPDLYAVAIDDTARDSNVNLENKRGYVGLLGLLCLWVNTTIVAIYTRTRVSYTATGVRLTGRLINLASGASYTSSLNWYVSMFMMWYICAVAGIARTDRVLIAEGDDSLIVVRNTPGNRMSLAAVDLDQIGRKLGKLLKLEGVAELSTGCVPFVGGYLGVVGGEPVFAPSYKRGWLKAGIVAQFGTDEWPYRKIYGLCRAKAQSVLDKYDRVPVYWAYANVLAGIYGLRARASEPCPKARELYARAGVSYDRQYYLESAIEGGYATPRDF